MLAERRNGTHHGLDVFHPNRRHKRRKRPSRRVHLPPRATPSQLRVIDELFDGVDARVRDLRGVEARCWVQVAGFPKSFAIADEDLPRENDEKTSAVHFLRFELDAPMLAALCSVPLMAAPDNYEGKPIASVQFEPSPCRPRSALNSRL